MLRGLVQLPPPTVPSSTGERTAQAGVGYDGDGVMRSPLLFLPAPEEPVLRPQSKDSSSFRQPAAHGMFSFFGLGKQPACSSPGPSTFASPMKLIGCFKTGLRAIACVAKIALPKAPFCKSDIQDDQLVAGKSVAEALNAEVWPSVCLSVHAC